MCISIERTFNTCVRTVRGYLLESGANATHRSSPYIAGMRAIATTIATGNTTVIVCSKSTPRCYWALGQIFHEAGLPAGVLNIIPYEPSTIGHCIHNPAVRKVNFTANSPESRRLSILCGHKPYIREIDSESCAIILSDADPDMAVSACLGTTLSKVCVIKLSCNNGSFANTEF